MKEPFSIVPRALQTNTSLSPTARLVLSWLIGLPPGWQLSVQHLRAQLGLSEKQWQRTRRELEAGGYFKQNRVKQANGRFRWHYQWGVEPGTISPNPSDGHTIDGKTTRCQSNQRQPAELKERLEKKEKRGRAIDPPLRADGPPKTKTRSNSASPSLVQHDGVPFHGKGDFAQGLSGIQKFLARQTGEKHDSTTN